MEENQQVALGSEAIALDLETFSCANAISGIYRTLGTVPLSGKNRNNPRLFTYILTKG